MRVPKMATVYPMQMLLAALALLLALSLATPISIATTSKEEIKCDTCKPVSYAPPPPIVVDCPPPPLPLAPPPPSLPPPSPTPSPPPPPSPAPSPSPSCPGCSRPPCSWCICILCPPPCPGCPPPPCAVCQIPRPRPTPLNQTGVVGGAVYSPPNEVVPYFPYRFRPPSESYSGSSTRLELELVVPIIILLLSATLSFF